MYLYIIQVTKETPLIPQKGISPVTLFAKYSPNISECSFLNDTFALVSLLVHYFCYYRCFIHFFVKIAPHCVFSLVPVPFGGLQESIASQVVLSICLLFIYYCLFVFMFIF